MNSLEISAKDRPVVGAALDRAEGHRRPSHGAGAARRADRHRQKPPDLLGAASACLLNAMKAWPA